MTATPATDALVAELRARGVEVLEHDDWSLMPQVYLDRLRTRPHDLLPQRPVDTLWNHITVTRDDGPLTGDFIADLRDVEDIGWSRFRTGFSYDVGFDQNADRPRLAIGQYLEARGAHTINDKNVPGYSKDQNKVSIGAAWIGMPGDKLNRHAIEAMIQFRRSLIAIDALTDHYDDVPHSLVAAKGCPTDELRNRLPDLKRRTLAGDLTPHHRQEDDMPSPKDWTAEDWDAVRRNLDPLAEDMNVHDPKGTPEFRGRDARWTLKRIYEKLDQLLDAEGN